MLLVADDADEQRTLPRARISGGLGFVCWSALHAKVGAEDEPHHGTIRR